MFFACINKLLKYSQIKLNQLSSYVNQYSAIILICEVACVVQIGQAAVQLYRHTAICRLADLARNADGVRVFALAEDLAIAPDEAGVTVGETAR